MELAGFLSYVVQQGGVILGTGAEILLLAGYLVALHKREHDTEYQAFSASLRRVQSIGIALVMLSGALVVWMHLAQGATGVIMHPAFVTKWILIIVLTGCFIAEGRGSLAHPWFRGFVGAQWLILFLLHVMAPLVGWEVLGLAYVVLLAASLAVWCAAIGLLRPRAAKPVATVAVAAVAPPPRPVAAPVVQAPPKPAPPPPPPKPVVPPPPPPPPPPTPKPVPPPPPPSVVPKPMPVSTVQSLPEVHHEALPAAHMAVPVAAAPKPAAVAAPVPPPAPHSTSSGQAKPAPVATVAPTPAPAPQPAAKPAYDETPDLPALRIMPKRPEDIPNQFRASAVQLDVGDK